MMDKFGKPLTDPARAAEGFLIPIGGPKGYGLALVFGLLAGTLNGAAFGKEVVDFNADSRSTTNTGHFIVALSIKAFMDVETFKRNVDDVIRSIHASPTLPGVDAVRVPGERSRQIRAERARSGIPLHPGLAQKLDGLARDLATEGLPEAP